MIELDKTMPSTENIFIPMQHDVIASSDWFKTAGLQWYHLFSLPSISPLHGLVHDVYRCKDSWPTTFDDSSVHYHLVQYHVDTIDFKHYLVVIASRSINRNMVNKPSQDFSNRIMIVFNIDHVDVRRLNCNIRWKIKINLEECEKDTSISDWKTKQN